MGIERVQVKAVWFGLTVALGIWFIGGVAGFLWVMLSDHPVINLGLFLYVLGIFGVVAGAFAAGKRSSESGWVHGLWVGLLLGLLGIIIELELVPELYSWAAIGRQLLVWTLWGLTGGYVGAFFRSQAHMRERKEKKRRSFLRG